LKKHEDGSISLIPTNATYDPLYYSKEEVRRLPVVVLGRVVELRAKF
jgi:repressor LexA